MITVLRLYCTTAFGRLHSGNPDIISLAAQIGRTPSAVALKAVNFASLDPTISQRGMANASALDRVVWREFFANMDHFVENFIEPQAVGFAENRQANFEYEIRAGLNVEVTATRRVNQGFFRDMMLATYDSKCAITGIEAEGLLVASHILPWAENPQLRTNPHNGLCLNSLHDRAFELGFIAVEPDMSIVYSPKLPPEASRILREHSAPRLMLPKRFQPDPNFLSEHRRTRFQN